MKRDPVGIDELVGHWTVLRGEHDPVDAKHGATRLGFALILKFYTRHGRFPRGRGEFPDEVVEHVAAGEVLAVGPEPVRLEVRLDLGIRLTIGQTG